MTRFKQLLENSVENDPSIQFDKWYEKRRTSGIINPGAFSLATSDSRGNVSVRTVLLKDYNHEGFVFYTNYNSRKGKQLSANNRAAMLFYWPEDGRQIRIEGRVQKVTSAESEKYFFTRPRESRIGAWASDQSTQISGKEYIEDLFKSFRDKFNGKNIPLPPYWGGFRITPLWFEFWQEGRHRLHDRLVYQPAPDGWKISRLAP